jgi:hypothetical protein
VWKKVLFRLVGTAAGHAGTAKAIQATTSLSRQLQLPIPLQPSLFSIAHSLFFFHPATQPEGFLLKLSISFFPPSSSSTHTSSIFYNGSPASFHSPARGASEEDHDNSPVCASAVPEFANILLTSDLGLAGSLGKASSPTSRTAHSS